MFGAKSGPYLTTFVEIWIALWTESNESGTEEFGVATYVGVYAMFGAFALLSLILGGMLVKPLFTSSQVDRSLTIQPQAPATSNRSQDCAVIARCSSERHRQVPQDSNSDRVLAMDKADFHPKSALLVCG